MCGDFMNEEFHLNKSFSKNHFTSKKGVAIINVQVSYSRIQTFKHANSGGNFQRQKLNMDKEDAIDGKKSCDL